MNARLWKFFSFAVLSCLLLSQCASLRPGVASRDQVLRERGYIPLPLDRVEGDVRFSREFLVSGTPMRLLIDSGANSTDVDGRKADLAGVKRLRSVSVVSRGALGREVKSGYGIGILQAGPVVAENFPFTLAPSGMRPTATSLYEGQIGLDGLSALSALVDIPRASLWVPGPDSVQARSGRKFPLGPLAGLGMKVLRLERAGRLPHLVLEGQLNGQPVSWVVDTGAEVSVMAAESFARFGLPSRRSDARIIDAAGDRIGIRHATLENVTFGDVIVRRFDIAVASLSQVRDVFRDSRGRPIDGILGMDFLTGGSALLDSESRLLYLVQN